MKLKTQNSKLKPNSRTQQIVFPNSWIAPYVPGLISMSL